MKNFYFSIIALSFLISANSLAQVPGAASVGYSPHKFTLNLNYQVLGLQQISLYKRANIDFGVYWTDSVRKTALWNQVKLMHQQAGMIHNQQVAFIQGLDLSSKHWICNLYAGPVYHIYGFNASNLLGGNQWNDQVGMLNPYSPGETLEQNNFEGISYHGGFNVIRFGNNERPMFMASFSFSDQPTVPGNQLYYFSTQTIWQAQINYLIFSQKPASLYTSINLHYQDPFQRSSAGITTLLAPGGEDYQDQLFGFNFHVTDALEPVFGASVQKGNLQIACFYKRGIFNQTGVSLNVNFGKKLNLSKNNSGLIPENISRAPNLKLTNTLEYEVADTGSIENKKTNPATPGKFYLELKHTFNFAVNDEQITASDELFLQQVVMLLKQNTLLSIKIIGHTDNSGNQVTNQDLSWRRARTVANYLIEKGGIDKTRCEISGAGDSYPLYPNDTPENRQKNRRVEFIIYE